MAIPASVQDFPGDDEYVAFNPDEAATITYYLKKRHIFGDLKVEVYDAKGKLLSTLPAGKRRGINRVSWPMRLPPPKLPPANSLVIGSQYALFGPRVPPGTYTVKLIQGDKTYTSQVELVPDPRSTHSAEDRAAQHETAMALYAMLGRLTYVADTVRALEDGAQERAKKLPAGDRLRRQLETLAASLETFRATLVATGPGGWLSGEEQLREKMAKVYGGVNGYDGRPTQSQLDAGEGAGRPAHPGRGEARRGAERRGGRGQPGAGEAQAAAAQGQDPRGVGEGGRQADGGAAGVPAVHGLPPSGGVGRDRRSTEAPKNKTGGSLSASSRPGGAGGLALRPDPGDALPAASA